MARFPTLSDGALSLREGLFARLAARLAECREEVFPFHIGDTFRLPPPAGQLAGRADLDGADLYRYGAPGGDPALLAALAERCRRRNGLSFAEPAAVQITTGATGALSAAVRAVLDPGDELLLLTPCWPLIRGIATAAGVVPVEVELSQRLGGARPEDVVALVDGALRQQIGPRTRALYLINPNNPDGYVFDRAALGAIAAVARDHDLWVISDEVYEDLVYEGSHTSVASLPGMAERTLTAFSLSKSLALAGLRLGYLVGDPRVIAASRKIVNHTIYNVPLSLQRAGLAALEESGSWMNETLAIYRESRAIASGNVAAPHVFPAGGAYLFIDLSAWLDPGLPRAEAVARLHDRLLVAGVALSPGAAFGTRHEAFARLCFTAMTPERVDRGTRRLAQLLGDATGQAVPR